jgi:stage II sporulation protein R
MKGYYFKIKEIQPGFYLQRILRFVMIILIFWVIINFNFHVFEFPVSRAGEKTEEVRVEDILRLHVKANSNSPEDQALKNYLARTIVSMYKPLWSECSSIEDLHSLLLEESKTIETAATGILQKKGCPHAVKVSLGKDIFPARFYEGKLYPPGEYEALKMIIGEGNGENWWCVLFPPLCFNLLPSPSSNVTDANETLSDAGKDQQSYGESKISGAQYTGQEKVGLTGAKQNRKIKLRSWLWDTFLNIILKKE